MYMHTKFQAIALRFLLSLEGFLKRKGSKSIALEKPWFMSTFELKKKKRENVMKNILQYTLLMKFVEPQTLKSHLNIGKWPGLGIIHLLHSVLFHVPHPAFCCHRLVCIYNINRLKTTQIYHSFEIQNGLHWVKIKVFERLFSFLEALGENYFPCSFYHRKAIHIPWLVVLFLHLQSQQQWLELFSYHITLTSSASQHSI